MVVKASDPPGFNQLISFVDSQISILESLEENSTKINLNEKLNNNTNNNAFKNSNVNTNPVKVFHNHIDSSKLQCPLCKNEHLIFNCNDYKKLSVEKRYDFIKQLKRCTNCLGTHGFFKYTSKNGVMFVKANTI